MLKNIFKKLGLLIPVLRRLHEERNKYANLAHDKSQELERMELKVQSLGERLEVTCAELESSLQGHLELSDYINQIKTLDSRLDGIDNKINSIFNFQQEKQQKIKHIHRKLNTILQRTSPRPKMIKVVFLVYYRRYWSTFEPIYFAMASTTDFDPIVVTIRDVCGLDFAEDYNELRNYLVGRGVQFIDWGEMDSEQSPSNAFLLENINPDIVFRQTHWEGNEPSAVRSEISAGYRLCYIPYGFEIAQTPAISTNQELHHVAWKLFLPSDLHVEHYKQHSLTKGSNAVAVGHPRLDAISVASAEKEILKHCEVKKFRVLWAPHHSVGADWLRFGTFHTTFKSVLKFAEENPDCYFVYREHHVLYDSLLRLGLFTKNEIDEFLASWNELENTEFDRDPSYIDSFSDSDLLLTDGVSFLAEYQVTKNPVVFIERDDHIPFTLVGERVMQGVYRCQSIDSALSKILELKVGGQDDLRVMREEISKELTCHPGNSVEKILYEIRSGLRLDFERRFFLP